MGDVVDSGAPLPPVEPPVDDPGLLGTVVDSPTGPLELKPGPCEAGRLFEGAAVALGMGVSPPVADPGAAGDEVVGTGALLLVTTTVEAPAPPPLVAIVVAGGISVVTDVVLV